MNTDPSAPASVSPPLAVGGGARSVRVELAVLLALVLGILALFCNKAFTIDDPLFLWLGKHLQTNPFDFYGFSVHWDYSWRPMHEVTKNPPLTGYYIAVAAALFGWSEVALHLAFLVPTGFAVAGTYLLARRLCAQPLLASLIGLLTPVFLVSSTNVMCDTMMLAFWCWSMWCWIRGFDRRRWTWLLAGSVLAILAGLTKYFGVCLLPLLAVYGLCRTRRLGSFMLFLLLPVAAFAAYQFGTRSAYGRGLLLDAAEFATTLREVHSGGPLQQSWVGLVFAGGCLVPALFFAPLLWRWRWMVVVLAVIAVALFVFRIQLPFVGLGPIEIGDLTPASAAQLIGLFCGGLSLLALTVADLRRHRDSDSLLLCLWVLGTFTFAAYMNWVNNGRSNLPMASALGILIVRRLSAVRAVESGQLGALRWVLLGASSSVALLVAHGDFRWANGIRSSVEGICARFVQPERRTLFVGHWGFQYYMQLAGALPLDVAREELMVSDIFVIPDNNTGAFALPERTAPPIATVRGPAQFWVQTVSPRLRAQFYASNGGFMPFAFGHSSPDTYRIMEVKRRSRIVNSASGG